MKDHTDYKVLGRMESFAQNLINMPEEMQNDVWKSLAEVFSADEIKGLQEYVGLYKMMTDEAFFKAVEKAVCKKLYEYANNK